ncbi:hypothetical protein IJ579_01440 [bacterium]|nr:hypothetical protein [bacterium]
MVECKNQGGRLPNASELAKIAQAIYNDNSISESEEYNSTDPTANNWDKSITTKLGIEDSTSWFALWGDLEDSSSYAWNRIFDSSYTEWSGDYRIYGNFRVVCIGG